MNIKILNINSKRILYQILYYYKMSKVFNDKDAIEYIFEEYEKLCNKYDCIYDISQINYITEFIEELVDILPPKHINNIMNKDGDTVLVLASWLGHINVVKKLLEYDIDEYIGGSSALCLAGQFGRYDIVELIIDHLGYDIYGEQLGNATVNPNMQTMSGHTILHMATKRNMIDLVNKILCFPDIDTSIRTSTTLETALDIAKRYNHKELIDILSNFDIDY